MRDSHAGAECLNDHSEPRGRQFILGTHRIVSWKGIVNRVDEELAQHIHGLFERVLVLVQNPFESSRRSCWALRACSALRTGHGSAFPITDQVAVKYRCQTTIGWITWLHLVDVGRVDVLDRLVQSSRAFLLLWSGVFYVCSACGCVGR